MRELLAAVDSCLFPAGSLTVLAWLARHLQTTARPKSGGKASVHSDARPASNKHPVYLLKNPKGRALFLW